MRLHSGVLLLAVLGCGRSVEGAIVATGTIEVVEVDAAPTAAARVVRVLVEEGQTVRAGDTLAILTQPTMDATIAQQEARWRAAEASLREAMAGPRGREIERAQAELGWTEAEADRATQDLERIRPLAERNVVSRQVLDAATAAARAAAARRRAAQETLGLLQEGTRQERLHAARAEVAAAQAALAAAKAVQGDLVLTAPIDGVILSRNTEPGEMLTTGQPAITLGQTAKPYVRVFVRTHELPRLRMGQTAAVVLDGFPDHPFSGKVVAISSRAEYTPRIALTERERADLVFGVKVALTDTAGILKPGLPATVHIATAAP